MRGKVLAVGLSVMLLAGVSSATETQWWSLDSPGDYVRSESRGIVVGADGVLSPGPEAKVWRSDSLSTIWGLAALADGSVAIAGDGGRIERWTAAGGIRPWVRLGSGQVLCLARDGDALLAGTGPEGRVYRISPKGDTTLVASTGERYVWAIVPAGRGVLWAATGTRGRLLRIEGGRSNVVFDSEESNLVSLVSDGHGGVYFGGDSQGRIYHFDSGGALTTLFDAAEDEIRALALGSDGTLWAAGLSLSAVSSDSDDEDAPTPTRGPVKGGRAVVYRLSPDSATVAWWTSPQPLIHALAASAAGPLVATGNRAGVYRLERFNGAVQLLAPSEAQVTALATTADGAVLAATSNPAALWKLGPGEAKDGELLSGPLDAKRFARFGRLRWSGAGTARFATRSGNAENPDTTWSPWRAVESDADGGRIVSPAARFLQWKVTLGGAASRISEVSIAWREPNLPPRIDEISVAPQGRGFREGEMSTRSEAVTQTLEGGQKIEYSATMSSNKPIRELPMWARGLRSLSWRASDPNGDALKFRVEIRREDGGDWIEIGKDLEASLFTWNTNTLPDGRYRLRVTASDAGANALGEERSGSLVGEPFAIDNTPPSIEELTGTGARIRGRAVDAAGPVSRIEVAVDDGEWRSVTPEGGFGDSRSEAFACTLPGLAPGEHLVSVRAMDLAGNSTTRAIHVKVAAAR